MNALVVLLFFNTFNLELHFGNTEDGLGMIFHGGVEHIEIGIFENGKAEVWRIESLIDDDYYYESVTGENEKYFLKISNRDGRRYHCKMRLADSSIQGKRLLASEKIRYIRKLRRQLLRLIEANNKQIKIGRNVLKEQTAHNKVILRFNRKGEVVFVEKNKGEEKRKYIYKVY